MSIFGSWWVRVFQTEKILDALIWLLLTGVKSDTFIEASSSFGLEWIKNCVIEPKVITAAADLNIKTFTQDDDVITQAADLCSWFAIQDRTQDLAIKIAKNVCLRDETYDILMWQIANGCSDALTSYQTKTLATDTSLGQLSSKGSVEQFQ